MHPNAKRYKVLIIDDDPLFRSLLVSLLRTDYLVSVATDGADGFYKAVKYPPDIAIVDIQMPEWDGITTLKAFRSHTSLHNTMIIMLTSDASRETVLSAIKEGANDYVIKTSFSKDELKQKVHRLVTRRERERLGLPRFTDNQAPIKAKSHGVEMAPKPRSKPSAVIHEMQVSVQPISLEAESHVPLASTGLDVEVADEAVEARYAADMQEIIDDWE